MSDGWSTGVLLRELRALYEGEPLPELSVQYADFAVWQRGWLGGEALEEQLSYWRRVLAGVRAVELPADRPRPAIRTNRGAHRTMRFGTGLGKALHALSREHGTTLFMTLLAAFEVLLRRLTGSADVAVGTLIANRRHAELEGLIGFFVNTLVMRGDLSGNPPFVRWLAEVRECALSAYAHQDLPFEKLVEHLNLERDLSRNPLFQVTFGLQNFALPELALGELALRPFASEAHTAHFDLEAYVWDEEDGPRLECHFDLDLFEPTTIRRLGRHFETLLESVAENPARRLGELTLMSPGQRQQLLREWSTVSDVTGVPGEASCLHELFAQSADRVEEAVAVVRGEVFLSYGRLDRDSDRLAARLRAAGVGPDVLVALSSERSPWMVTGMLAIHKAGGAYLPLDPAYPRERLDWMLEDSGARVCLAGAELHLGGKSRPDSQGGSPLRTTPEQLAYVLYTSGSTGRPKGVTVSHRSAVALLTWAAEVFSPRELACVLASTSISFDLSVFEIFLPLVRGGTVVLVDDVLELPRTAHRVTLVNTVPSALREVLELGDWPESVRCVNLAGEPLRRGLVERVPRGPRVLNLYGPSEDTTYSTYSKVGMNAAAEPSIGRPIAGTTAHVVDASLSPVPHGAAGELCLGGVGLARGYLKRPALTAERFVPDPYAANGSRLYRTGDRARFLASGEFDFLGRIGYQVKIRGFRVEPEEVEVVLTGHPNVDHAAVVARTLTGPTRRGERQLVAFFVAHGVAPTPAELRAFLEERLPAYMVPAVFVILEQLPATASGKIDRSVLAETATDPAPASAAPPRTTTEEVLVGIWCRILEIDRAGVHDDFFKLGGHSLLATRLVSQVRRVFGKELPVRDLFENPTVASLARRLDEADATGLPSLEPAGRDRELPLSFAQQRLWFLDRLNPGQATYNLPMAARLEGPLDTAALERGLAEVVRRQESLRTTFPAPEGRPMQVVREPSAWRLPVIDLRGVASADAEGRQRSARRLVARQESRPFDLAEGPLLRAFLVRTGDGEAMLSLCLHHIVSDGWSIGVLLRELHALYEGEPLPELPVQYADFALWQRSWLAGQALDEQLGYWRRKLEGLRVLELPAERPRPVVRRNRGEHYTTRFGAQLGTALHALSRKHGTTLFMTLLAAFEVLLHRLSGRTDVAVGTLIANRRHADLEGLIGFFVNTLVMRGDLSGDPPFAGLLEQVREGALGAYAYQDLPFEKLIEHLKLERDLSRNPLFQVTFGLQSFSLPKLGLGELTLRPLAAQTHTTHFDLATYMWDEAEGPRLECHFDLDLFDRTTIRRLVSYFETLLRGVVEDPDQRLAELPLASPGQRQQVLREWASVADVGEGSGEESCLHELFARRAARVEESVAVVYGEVSFSYGQLDRESDRLAARLQAAGVGPEVLVALMSERSPWMVAGMLAVQKAGGAYLPLDPAYPRERLDWMLEDSGAEVLVSWPGAQTKVDSQGGKGRPGSHGGRPGSQGGKGRPGSPWTKAKTANGVSQPALEAPSALGARQCFDISTALGRTTPDPFEPNEGPATTTRVSVASATDSGRPSIVSDFVRRFSGLPLPPEAGRTQGSPLRPIPDQLAYVLYTSGSTGRPKGVMVSHRNAAALLTWAAEVFSTRDLGRRPGLDVDLLRPVGLRDLPTVGARRHRDPGRRRPRAAPHGSPGDVGQHGAFGAARGPRDRGLARVGPLRQPGWRAAAPSPGRARPPGATGAEPLRPLRGHHLLDVLESRGKRCRRTLDRPPHRRHDVSSVGRHPLTRAPRRHGRALPQWHRPRSRISEASGADRQAVRA